MRERPPWQARTGRDTPVSDEKMGQNSSIKVEKTRKSNFPANLIARTFRRKNHQPDKRHPKVAFSVKVDGEGGPTQMRYDVYW